ncbi:hypothetical protein O3P69_002734 [Scylla paramamosain]|uniref:ABC-2 type transporter transmembrane domain-containing protein n=2 Tax=Scylla paramamosain TaxID=85552 RepID=A0AAW0UMB4_SCYPA
MFSAMFESLPYAMVMLVPFLMMLLITGGLMVNLASLPPYVGWIKYFSWFMYSNEALTVVQWEGVKNITCETGPHVPCLTEGRSVMQKFTFNYQHVPMDLVCMTVLFICFHTIGFLGLMSRARRK